MINQVLYFLVKVSIDLKHVLYHIVVNNRKSTLRVTDIKIQITVSMVGSKWAITMT